MATTVLQLVEAGRFALDVPLGAWLPELERPGRLPFTAWHVLSHTTGMDDLDLEELLDPSSAVGGTSPNSTSATPSPSVPGSQAATQASAWLSWSVITIGRNR